MRLSIEIVEEILIYLPFELSIKVHLGSYIKKYIDIEEIWNWAAMSGNLEIIQLLHNGHEICRICTANVMDDAVANGHFEIVKFLYENCTEHACSAWAMDDSDSSDHFKFVKFCFKNRNKVCTKHAADNAIINGHQKIIQFLKNYLKN
jgi:hypothetical protein